VAEVRAELPPGTPVEVWFQDEMRVGQKNKLTYRWARKGSRPRATNRVFKSFDEIVDHCCFAWNTLIDQPWKIMSIARRDWVIAGQSL
jgi:hypothetical protein